MPTNCYLLVVQAALRDRMYAMPSSFSELIHAARDELVVTTPYFVPDEQLLFALTSAARRGVTTVMIEQYVHRALDFADDCLVLQHGTVAWSGPADKTPEDLLRHYLGDAVAATF